MTPIVANKKGNGFMLEAVTDWEFTEREGKECLRIYLASCGGSPNAVNIYGDYIPYVRHVLGIDEADNNVRGWMKEWASE